MSATDPLVLLPGLQSDHRSWVHQLKHFEGKREVLVPRGHQQCGSIAEMVESVLEQLPEQFHLVAWSMGGYIALQMLPYLAGRMRSLVLLSTTARPENPASTPHRLALIAQAEREGMGAASTKSIAFSCHDISQVDGRVRDGLLHASIELGIDAYRKQQHAIIARPDSRGMLMLVSCPTLVLVGDADLVTPRDCAEELHHGIAGSEFRLIGDCGHCPPLEHPDLINAVLDLWLARHDSGRSLDEVMAS
ncbi:MAG: alpha/beta fold hydrolase [Devosia sp.]|uniref:alpha/beta fold hydrolase n=1 Tax=Devosia sp. TaxID=1871048 RepID=UPI001A44B56D|nr:alpha/beta fold hydrolase [Devosia sp.]MBL8600008.1 alpha/beta fold hydrolase [Devosia sp.]